jgi:hypothetical protein
MHDASCNEILKKALQKRVLTYKIVNEGIWPLYNSSTNLKLTNILSCF